MVQKGPQKKRKGQNEKKSEKHLKKLMDKIKGLIKTKPPETQELIDEFSKFFDNKKPKSIDLNQKLDDGDSILIHIDGNKYVKINNPVFAIIALGYPGILKVFIKNGAKLTQRGNKSAQSLAEFAVSFNKPNCLKVLLDVAGYDELNPIDQEFPLLTYAASISNFECVITITTHSSFDTRRLDETERSKTSKRTALHFAAIGGHADVAKCLLEKGATFKPDHVGMLPYDSMILSFYNYLFGNKFPVTLPDCPSRDYYKTIQLFLETGLINPILISCPSGLNSPQKIFPVLHYLPHPNTQGLKHRKLLIETMFLYLAHGVGINIELVPNYIKELCNTPVNADLIVISKKNERYYYLDALITAIQRDPFNFNLKSIFKACSSPQAADTPAVRRLREIIQNLLHPIEMKETSSVNHLDPNELIGDLLNFSETNLDEARNSEFRECSEAHKEEVFANTNMQIMLRTENIRQKTIQHRPALLMTAHGNGTENLQLQSYSFSVCYDYFHIMRYLCIQKSILMATSPGTYFDARLKIYRKNLSHFLNCYIYGTAQVLYSGDLKKLCVFHRAVIHGLQYLKKHHKLCKIEDHVLSEINALIAASASRILLNSMADQNKNESQYYLKLLQSALPFDDLAFRKSLPEHNSAYLLKRDCYGILALAQIEDGYYGPARKTLLDAIDEGKKAKSVGNELLGTAVLYMMHFLDRRDFAKTDEILNPLLELMTLSGFLFIPKYYNPAPPDSEWLMMCFPQFFQDYEREKSEKLDRLKRKCPLLDEPNKIILDATQGILEIEILDQCCKQILRYLENLGFEYTVAKVQDERKKVTLKHIHRIPSDEFESLLRKIKHESQHVKEKLQRKLEEQLQDEEHETNSEADAHLLTMQFSTLTFSNQNKRVIVKKIKVKSLLDEKDQAEIEAPNAELESDLDEIYKLLELPKAGYSKPIMIRSPNGGFPDSTHFLCIKESEEFKKFLLPLHSREENVTYSIPEKGRGQRGVKISHDHNEIRVKPYGDERAVGHCTKVVKSKSGAKIRLYLVDEIKTHKQRARAQKHGVKK